MCSNLLGDARLYVMLLKCDEDLGLGCASGGVSVRRGAAQRPVRTQTAWSDRAAARGLRPSPQFLLR